jgi:hypothetical protein
LVALTFHAILRRCRFFLSLFYFVSFDLLAHTLSFSPRVATRCAGGG